MNDSDDPATEPTSPEPSPVAPAPASESPSSTGVVAGEPTDPSEAAAPQP